MTNSDADASIVREAAKRPYTAPALVTHGSVRTLTETVKTGEASDGDNGSFTASLADDEPAGG